MTGHEQTDVLIIGVGHRHRQDDGVGPHIAEVLAGRGLQAVVHEGDGAGLMLLWEGCKHCILVDALAGDDAPGTIRRLTGDPDELQTASFVHSTHKVGIAEAVMLGRELDRLPDRLEIIGIAGQDFGFGEELSDEVGKAAESVIEALAEEVKADA